MKYLIILLFLILFIDIYIVEATARYICDRTYPQNPKLIGRQTNRKSGMSKSKQRALELEENIVLDFHITGVDDVDLVGHYYPCENAKRVVIAVHGWRSSWSYDFNKPAQFLHENNCSVLFIENRAHGNSGGRYMYFGKMERLDLVKWSLYVKDNLADGLPIYFWGMSMGSTLSVMASNLFDESVYGIIADGVTPTPRIVIKSIMEYVKVNPKIFYPQVRLALRLKLGFDDNDYTALMALENNKIPILMPYGTADKLTTVAMSMQVFNAIKSKKTCVEFEGAGHMKSFYTDEEKYKKAVSDFFKDCENKG